MKDSLPITVQRATPSFQSVALSYILALSFILFALFLSFDTIKSPGAFLWLIGAGWLGRAIEKSSAMWKILRLERLTSTREES